MNSSFLNFDENLAYQLVLNAPLGIACVSKAGDFLEVNPKLCDLLGYSRDEMLGMSVFSITHESDLDASHTRHKKILSGEISGFDLEKRYIRKDGSLFWVRVTVRVTYEDDGEIKYFVATFEDVSEKKAYAEAFLNGERKYHSILETTREGFWIVDFDMRICEVNAAYCRMIGYTREELLGMRIPDIEAVESVEDIANRQASLEKYGNAYFHTRHRCKNGTTISLSVSASYSPELGNKIFAFFHDRTEIEQSIAELRFSSLIAKEAKDAVVAISETTLRQIGQELHDDLGQLLTGAAMLADALNKHESIDEKSSVTSSELAKLLNEAAKRTRSISHELYPVELKNNGLMAMIQSLVNRINANAKNFITLKISGQEFNLDEKRSLHVYRIVQEAISNIIRHSQSTKAIIDIANVRNKLVLKISDNGIGLPNLEYQNNFANGIGLKGMRYRAEKIDAALTFENLRQGGLLIQLSVPLN